MIPNQVDTYLRIIIITLLSSIRIIFMTFFNRLSGNDFREQSDDSYIDDSYIIDNAWITTKDSQQGFKLWQIMFPVRRPILVAMLMSGLATLFMLSSLCCLAWAVHLLWAFPGEWPVQALMAAFGCTIGSYVLRLMAFSQSHNAAFRLETILRSMLVRHASQLSQGAIQSLGVGALSKVIQDDVKSLHVFVADSTPLFARAILTPLLTLGLLMWLNWQLALAAIAVLLLGGGVMRFARRNAANMYQQYNKTRERVSGAVIEFVQAMPVIRTFDSSSATFSRYQNALTDWLAVVTAWYRQSSFSARFSFAILNPLPTILVLLWVSDGLNLQVSMTFSHWVGVLLLVSGMAESVMPFMMLSRLVAQTRMSIERIRQVMCEPVFSEPVLEKQPRDGSIRFEHVSFRYGEQETETLHDVDFTVPAGSVVALVGPSGSGKTTVTRLLLKFWETTEGRIRIGGVEIRAMTAETLMQQISFVFQDNFLFADTIINNIRLGQTHQSRAAVIAAAKAAQAHEFIQSLPQGYDTPVGERGTLLSGGQCQRIAIARAILQDRPIIVLDEPTAFADPENEAKLIRGLAALIVGKTVVMVAHRLSMVVDADQILVFSQGRLVESGHHAQLVAQRGLYARLWQQYQQVQHWRIGESSSLAAVEEHA
jgi:ATP-binding cassette subfamily B protein